MRRMDRACAEWIAHAHIGPCGTEIHVERKSNDTGIGTVRYYHIVGRTNIALITVPAMYRCGTCSQYHIIYHQVSFIFYNTRPLRIKHLVEIFNLLADREHVFFNSIRFSLISSKHKNILMVFRKCLTKCFLNIKTSGQQNILKL